MDAEGARALARRIEEGPPRADAAEEPGPDAPRARPILEIEVYRTVKTELVVAGRPAILRQRLRSTVVAGAWTTSVIEERLDYLD